MNTMTIREETKREQEIKEMLRQELRRSAPLLHGHKVFLFGSRAAKTARPRSDYDLGVYGAEPLALDAFYEIEDRLEALPTLYKIDWVDLNRASAEFRQQALKFVEPL